MKVFGLAQMLSSPPNTKNLRYRKMTLPEKLGVLLQSPCLGSLRRWFSPEVVPSFSCLHSQFRKAGGSTSAEPLRSALPPPALNWEHTPGRTKQWQLMTNGLSGPHVPLPIPCYHGDTSQLKPRDQEISIKDSLVDTGAGGINRHQQDPLVCGGLQGERQWDGGQGTK